MDRIVRVNDGHDSNEQREDVERAVLPFEHYFFNTAIPNELDTFSGPVVLTLNPAEMTDTHFHRLDPIPTNLMYVRFRTNIWNLHILHNAVLYYTNKHDVPVVLTFMAYYETPVPPRFQFAYEWKKRTSNPYWCIRAREKRIIEDKYLDNELVYSCGYKDSHSCMRCGNCVREYYNTIERMRKIP